MNLAVGQHEDDANHQAERDSEVKDHTLKDVECGEIEVHDVVPSDATKICTSVEKTQVTREQAVTIARAWVGTRYVLGGRIRGAGADCATYIAEYMIECGFADRSDLGLYASDWFCHASEERYKFGLIRYAKQTIQARCRGTIATLPGSIALFKVAKSKVYNHGGIITAWPKMIHAVDPFVQETDCVRNYMTSQSEMCIFDPWERPC